MEGEGRGWGGRCGSSGVGEAWCKKQLGFMKGDNMDVKRSGDPKIWHLGCQKRRVDHNVRHLGCWTLDATI